MHELYSQVSIKDEKYDPFNWNTIGSLILMCGGGLVIKLAGAGVITLETAIGIMAGGGAAVGGGTELANQVQSGGAVNPGAIATRTAFGGVKGALWGLAPELGAVGFGASIGAYSAIENLTYNAAKGKTTASDSIEAIAGGLGEGIFAGIMHKASSKASGKASESTPAKPEPIKQMTEAELEKVSGGAKDPGWRPEKIGSKITNSLGVEIDISPSNNHITVHENPGPKGIPNSSVDILDDSGNIATRRWYNSKGNAYRDVDMTNHGNPKMHPEFPHEHIWDWVDGKPRRGR